MQLTSECNGKAHAAEQPPAAQPSPNGRNGSDRGDGRTAKGQLAKGNPGGPGNPSDAGWVCYGPP